MTKLILFIVAVLVAWHSQAAERSPKMRHWFQYAHPCPANGQKTGPCPGFVVDHIKPLACGGADHPDNMQWQSVEDGRAKDKWERKECGGD